MTAKEAREIAKDHARIRSNIKKIENQFGRNLLAEAMGVSLGTFNNRLYGNIKTFYGYDELKAISRITGIDFVSIAEGEVDLG